MFGDGVGLLPIQGEGHRFCMAKGMHPLLFIVRLKLEVLSSFTIMTMDSMC